jgi:hypothetical protein
LIIHISINNLELKGVGVSKKVLSFQGAWDGKNTRLSAKAKGKNLAGMVLGWSPFKNVSDSPALHSKWLLLLKIDLSSF